MIFNFMREIQMNNIVIGLGGTGGKIINKLKHKLYEKNDIPVEYLYIDSNFDLVIRDKHLWKAFGNDISLGVNNKYRLSSDALNGAFNFHHNLITPRYKEWAGKIENWKDIEVQLSGGDGAVFGNQRRRLGRMLLSGHIDNILNRVNFLVQGLQRKTRTNVNKFHICSGLSGGTGSGSFIDILAKLKQAYPGGNNEFILYLFLPEDNPDSRRVNGGNYFANAYSALKELNALYTDSWTPYDISRLNQKIDIGNNTSFISTTYLVTNSNESSCLLDVEEMQPEEMVADFISLRLTNSTYGGSLSGVENAGARQAENENGQNVRSRDFFSFGIKRVIYPKEEISEYMIYQVLHKVSLALRFNHWNEQSGYIPNENIKNINLLTSKLLKEFKLTPEYLLLGSGILENESKWENFEDEWIHYIDNYAKNASEKRGMSRKEIVTNLSQLCAKKYNTLYRKVGVKDFFQDARRQTNTRVTHVSKAIQEYLISSWLKGDISLPQIEMVINEIIQLLNKQNENFTQKHNALDKKIKDSRDEITFSKKKLLDAYVPTQKKYNNTLSALKDYYIYRTYNEAYSYSGSFIAMLITHVQDFKRNYNNLVSQFKKFSDELEASYNIRLINNSNDTIEKIYDKPLIDELLENVILNNKDRMDLFKNSIEKLIDGKKEFTSLVKVFGSRDFKYDMESVINEELYSVIQNVANTQPQFDIANKNIIKELEDKYGNDNQALQDYMHGLISESKFYLPFDNVELQEVIDNNRIQAHNPSAGFVLYPDIHNEQFTQSILTALKRQNQTQLQRGDGLRNELTIFDIQPTFPLRYILKAKRLQREYLNRYENIEQGDIDVKIHLEGTKDSYSDFLLPSIAELQQKSIYKLFILDALGLIERDRQFDLHIKLYKGKQRVGELKLGDEFITAHRELSSVNDNMTINMILTEKLAEIRELDYQQKEDRKSELEKSINNKYKEIEDYYNQRDISKISFWGEHANRAINNIKEL
jgi:hypothetical protein